MNKFWLMNKKFCVISTIISLGTTCNISMTYASLNNWTGYYVGLNTGMIHNNNQLTSRHLGFTNPSETCNNDSNFSSLNYGLQLGSSYRLSHYAVSSIEVNLVFNAKSKDKMRCNSAFNSGVFDDFTFKHYGQSSIKGRLGKPITWHQNIFVPFLSLGASFADVELSYKNEANDNYNKHAFSLGWLVGAGFDWPFKQNWSMRAEYNYQDYGNVIKLKIPQIYGLLDSNGKAAIKLNSNSINLSINYWFN